jgi:hypothetical protein
MSDRLIINAALGSHYIKGQNRLVQSLSNTDYFGHIWVVDKPPSQDFDLSNPYTVKASAFEHVLSFGYRFIVWMDASAVAVNNLDPLFERIEQRGYYLASSGYSAAQTCTDAQLEAANMTRDGVVSIPDSATGCIGIDTHNPRSIAFLNQWITWAKMGLFGGSRTHDVRDSKDPRFLFGRQDQSAATLLAFNNGMDLDHLGDLTGYWPPNDTTVMVYKGIQ